MKLYKAVFFCVICLSVFSFCADLCFASEESIREMQKEIQLLKDRIAELEKRLEQETVEIGEQKKELVKQEEELKVLKPDKKPTFEMNGLRIGVQGTFIGQGTNNANLPGSSKKNKLEGSCQIDLEMEKKFSLIDGRGYVNIRAGEGEGADRVLALYSGVDNNKADDKHLWITPLFYEQFLFNRKAVLNIGKIDSTMFFDLNRLAGSDSLKFLGCIFNNNPVIEFPDQNLGLRLGITPLDPVELTFLALNGNEDWEDIDDHLFSIAQLTFKPNFLTRKDIIVLWHGITITNT